MACSTARHLANCANSAKSTGPRTPEGKLASRRNSLKHGLTGEGVVVREEDSGEIAERAEVLQAELAPGGGLMTQILIKRVAAMSVRTERCVRHESSMIADRVRTAPEDFDEARQARASQLFDDIALDPANHHRQLLTMPEGVDLLLEVMAELHFRLIQRASFPWTEAHAKTFDDCTGRRLGSLAVSKTATLTEAILGRFDRLDPSKLADIAPEARSDWAAERMIDMVEQETNRLHAHRLRLDIEAIELSRAEASERALFDPGHEATLARKYEANAERAMYKALKDLREVQSNAEAQSTNAPQPPQTREPIDQSTPQPSATQPPLGSFFPEHNIESEPPAFASISDHPSTTPYSKSARSEDFAAGSLGDAR